MAVAEENTSLDMILVGRTGDGKSETGNSILGRDVFPTSSGLKSMTIKAHYDIGHRDDYDLKVVDCPGLGDTRENVMEDLQQFIEAVKVAIANNPTGYHAFIYVLKFINKFTRVDELTVFTFKQLLGDTFIKNHGILIMTFGDNFETEPNIRKNNITFDQWLASQDNTTFKNLRTECSNRVILFDNRTEDLNKKRAQMEKLVDHIKRLASRGKRYTNEDFEEVEKKRNELLGKFRKEQERLDYVDKIGALISKIKNARESSEALIGINEEIDDLEKSVKTALSENKTLKPILYIFPNVRVSLKAKEKKDLTETLKQFKLLENKYVQLKNSTTEDILLDLMNSMKNRFSIKSLFDKIVNFFKRSPAT